MELALENPWVLGFAWLALFVVAIIAVSLGAALVLGAVRAVFWLVFGSFRRFLLIAAALFAATWFGLLDWAAVAGAAPVLIVVVIAAAIAWQWLGGGGGATAAGRRDTSQDGSYVCPRCGVGAHPEMSCPQYPGNF